LLSHVFFFSDYLLLPSCICPCSQTGLAGKTSFGLSFHHIPLSSLGLPFLPIFSKHQFPGSLYICFSPPSPRLPSQNSSRCFGHHPPHVLSPTIPLRLSPLLPCNFPPFDLIITHDPTRRSVFFFSQVPPPEIPFLGFLVASVVPFPPHLAYRPLFSECCPRTQSNSPQLPLFDYVPPTCSFKLGCVITLLRSPLSSLLLAHPFQYTKKTRMKAEPVQLPSDPIVPPTRPLSLYRNPQASSLL